jgi:hypothetical protein
LKLLKYSEVICRQTSAPLTRPSPLPFVPPYSQAASGLAQFFPNRQIHRTLSQHRVARSPYNSTPEPVNVNSVIAMNTFRAARFALRARPTIAFRRGYAEAAGPADKIRLSLSVPHQVGRHCAEDKGVEADFV